MQFSLSINKILFLVIPLCCFVSGVHTQPSEQRPLSADQIAKEVYTAAHGGLLDNAVSRRLNNEVALVVNRAPLAMRDRSRKPTVQTFDTYVNNSPEDPSIESMQMAILTSGKTRGTGVLFTSFNESDRQSVISMWLPALRKIRRINEPAHEDVWFGTNLTYGELVLRRPEDETHELLGEGVMQKCLAVMELKPSELTRYTRDLPPPQCGHKGKAVYRLKSATKFHNWWYDYHVSDIDKETFALYRTVYYKGDEKVKTVYIDWQSLDQPDPRITYPRYIYAITHADGKDSLVYVPRSTISLNVDLPDTFWSEETLQNYNRIRKP
ncbi:MAG: outer membrane lipoprotein-sorting protein [Candidatus Thiodiazotropha sp. (ex Monitilora ramsayi)]|nr:outer membrane lipoprotein-sorting protein [Candidatus Thiodiazotropha sp. (ex Monitilora ramsayi)]